MKTPPDGDRTSNLNFGRPCCISSPLRVSTGSDKSVCEKFAEMGFGGGGQRVISVA